MQSRQSVHARSAGASAWSGGGARCCCVALAPIHQAGTAEHRWCWEVPTSPLGWCWAPPKAQSKSSRPCQCQVPLALQETHMVSASHSGISSILSPQQRPASPCAPRHHPVRYLGIAHLHYTLPAAPKPAMYMPRRGSPGGGPCSTPLHPGTSTAAANNIKLSDAMTTARGDRGPPSHSGAPWDDILCGLAVWQREPHTYGGGACHWLVMLSLSLSSSGVPTRCWPRWCTPWRLLLLYLTATNCRVAGCNVPLLWFVWAASIYWEVSEDGRLDVVCLAVARPPQCRVGRCGSACRGMSHTHTSPRPADHPPRGRRAGPQVRSMTTRPGHPFTREHTPRAHRTTHSSSSLARSATLSQAQQDQLAPRRQPLPFQLPPSTRRSSWQVHYRSAGQHSLVNSGRWQSEYPRCQWRLEGQRLLSKQVSQHVCAAVAKGQSSASALVHSGALEHGLSGSVERGCGRGVNKTTRLLLCPPKVIPCVSPAAAINYTWRRRDNFFTSGYGWKMCIR